MEHSKIPWMLKRALDHDEYARIFGWNQQQTGTEAVTIGEVRIENAEFIIKACNEHDTLKVIAALHDELVKELENSTGQMRLITGFDQERKRRIEALLAKCKETGNV